MSTLPTRNTRIAIRNILFATDFSDVSEMAVPYLKALAGRYGAKVFVTHVYPPEPTYEVPMVISPGLPHNRAAAEEGMQAFLQANDFSSVPHSVCLRAGDVWLELSEITAENDIDLIVLGSHGRKGLKGLLLGSVAEEVIRQATCPVMTVTPHVSSGSIEGEFRHILYATDFSPGSLRALQYALGFAQESNAQVTLLHAIEEPPIELSEEWPDAELAPARQTMRLNCSVARERLSELLPSGTDLWCVPELLVQVGPAADTILHMAEARHADLVVMGARHRRLPQASAHVPWNTVRRVISNARCPVLTVREQAGGTP